jgi:hypothetical protein
VTNHTSIRPSDLTPAERAILRKEDRGTVAIMGEYDKPVARRLARRGLLKHRHGLIYEVQPTGATVVAALREEDAACA